MKQFLSTMILSLALLLLNACATTPEPAKATSAQTSPTATQSTANAEQEIIKLEQDFGAITAQNGVAFMERVEADEYLYTDSKGRTFTKAQDIANFKSREQAAGARELKDTKVHVLGDIAVITAQCTDKGKDKDGPFDVTSRFTDIWIKRNGSWQCLASHSSNIPKEKK